MQQQLCLCWSGDQDWEIIHQVQTEQEEGQYLVMQCALSGSWWGVVVNLMCSVSIFEGIEPSSWRNAFTCLHVALQGQIYIHMELIIAKVMVDGLVVSVQQ